MGRGYGPGCVERTTVLLWLVSSMDKTQEVMDVEKRVEALGAGAAKC